MILDNKPLPIWKIAFEAITSYSPGSETFGKDLALVIACVFMQLTLIRSTFLNGIVIDIATPLVTLLAIKSNIRRSLFFGTLTALLVEMHSAAPLGLYISCYWVFAVVIHFIRPHISWRQRSSWVYVFLATQFSTILMSLLTVYLRSHELALNFTLLGLIVFQLTFSLILLQALPAKWMEGDFGEERSW